MENQTVLSWRDGVPVSARFDDPYYSLDDGLAETRHVFLDGNDLPARLCDGFHVAELGFGTGLNALVTAAAWDAPGRLRFTSFEMYPLEAREMAEALAPFDALDASALVEAWARGQRLIELPNMSLEVIEGDARETLPRWEGRADAWYLDGFSPAKNPELWSHDLLAEVARHTAPNGTAASYTAAGHVRRALSQAGFDVSRVAGYGRKRHMTRARLGCRLHGGLRDAL